MAKTSKSKKRVTTKSAESDINAGYLEALAQYGNRPNVTGVDRSSIYNTNGEKTGEVIRIHVKEKLPLHALEAAEIFPEEIKGIPIKVIQANYKTNLMSEASSELVDRTQRFSKIQPGISISHTTISGGTLGLIVKDNKTGKPAILSNWHVLAGKDGKPGDDITQPGRNDGGQAPRDTIASLERMILNNEGDAAIALITNNRPFGLPIMDLNSIPNTLKDPQDGDIVIKSGRTTEITKGRVEGRGRYFIDYIVGRIGIDGFRITTIEKGNPGNIEISRGGDSGSAWLLDNTQTMVGLHFAGETDPRPEEEHALACYASTVFSRLDISLMSEEIIEEVKINENVFHSLSNELGKAALSNLFNNVDSRQIRLWARLLERSYPRLVSGDVITNDLEQIIKPEISALGVVAIGFATGAVSKLVNEDVNNSISSEAFSLAVSAFMAGAVAGTKSMEGRL